MPWERDDTKTYIADIEALVHEVLDFKAKALKFCADRDIDDPQIIIGCVIMSAAWVYYNMGHVLTKGIVPDLLKLPIEEIDRIDARTLDDPIILSKEYRDMSHTEILNKVTEIIE